MNASLAISLAVVLLSAHARAGGVRIVDPVLGATSFADPQSAIDSAPEGSVLLVAEGTYPGFSIAGKSLSLFAMPGATVNIQDAVSVSGLSVSQTVVLNGMRVSIHAEDTPSAITVVNCLGNVRVESSSFHSADYGYYFCFGQSLHTGAPGASVSSSARVVFRACTLTGGRGEGLLTGEDTCVCHRGDGGAGLVVSGGTSRVVLYDCASNGGDGGSAEGCQGSGGAGLKLSGGATFASACAFQGGRGGDDNSAQPVCGGHGGDGGALSGTATLRVIGCSSEGGTAGFPYTCGGSGLAYEGGPPAFVPGFAAMAAFSPAVISDLRPLSIWYQGGSGDGVFLVVGSQPASRIAIGPRGPLLEKPDPFLLLVELGTADTNGALYPQVQIPDLPAGSSSLRAFVQVSASGPYCWTFGSAASLLVLDRDSGPDCDLNGLNDFVQLIENPAQDANHNLIPDSCPGG